VDAGAARRLEQVVRDAAGLPLPVRVRAWDGSEAGPTTAPVVQLRQRRALRRLLWSPNELGLSRAFISGDMDVTGPGGRGAVMIEALRLGWAAAEHRPSQAASLAARMASVPARARAAATSVRLAGVGRPPRPPMSEARLIGGLHSRARDRAAISHHYDLSNSFYELLLDETMAYSCAYPATADDTLHDAQRAKLDLICGKLGLRPGQQLLDVGCGWGSLLLHAAEHYGVHVTGITLSANQHDFVTKRIAERGLADRAQVLLADYRELRGAELDTARFDAVASIEMGEHVGETNYGEYAAMLYRAVRPGGRLLLQQMSRRADAAPGGGAFIETYIAPDMHMRPVAQTVEFLHRAGFAVDDVQAMGHHYVWTAQRWLDRLDEHYDEFVAMAGAEVARVWLLYLAGGALSFEQGRMGVEQILATRPAGTR
jgi:cyclopropane-fatty-acyl-phospholipid synthase